MNNEEEQANIAYFDDVSIEHNHSAVIQEESYYLLAFEVLLSMPFGMSQHYSYQRGLSKEQRYTYNGKESITDLDLGWLDFGARMYQADLGRWFNVDPMAEKYYDMTPYKYGLNNPMAYTDPNGMTEVYGTEMDLGATGVVQNVFSASSGGGEEEKKKGGCGEPGNPCPNGTDDEEENLMPEDAVSYKDVVPNGTENSSSNEEGAASGVLSWVGVGAGIVGEGADLVKSSQTVTVPVYDKTGKAIAGWKVISKQTGKVLNFIKAGASGLGYLASGAGVALDTYDYANGNISGARFSYRTIGTGTAIGVGIVTTSGVGALVGASFIGAEYAYDLWMQNIQPVINQGYSDLNNALNNNWRPR